MQIVSLVFQYQPVSLRGKLLHVGEIHLFNRSKQFSPKRMLGRQQRGAVHKIILLEGFSVHGIICNEINHWEIKF